MKTKENLQNRKEDFKNAAKIRKLLNLKPPKPKTIMATITGDHTLFSRRFDCTKAILNMPFRKLKKLEDCSYESDELAPQELIDEARELFESNWGQGTKNITFGFEVHVVDELLVYYSVDELEQLCECKLCSNIQSIDRMKEHLESHNSNCRSMDMEEVSQFFER